MNFEDYGTDYLAILALIFFVATLLFESEGTGNEKSFITSKNFYNWFWGGAALLVFGVLLHLTIGQFKSSPIETPPKETVIELLMLQRVAYHTSIWIALGYALILSAIFLKVMNIYFICRKKDERDI